MVYTPEVIIDNSKMSPIVYVPLNNHSTKKSLRHFSKLLGAQPKTSIRRLGAAKSNRKAIRTGHVF